MVIESVLAGAELVPEDSTVDGLVWLESAQPVISTAKADATIESEK